MRYSLTLLALLPLIAHAQIYQYVDPETGSTKLTNITPPWYSANLRGTGPRTLLIVRGHVVNDTNKPADGTAVQSALKQAAELYASDERQIAATHAAQQPRTASALDQALANNKASLDAFAKTMKDINEGFNARRAQVIQGWQK